MKKQSSKHLGGQVRAIQRKRDTGVPVKKMAVPYLPAELSSCGQRAYIGAEDAQVVGAVLCRGCGLYHAAVAA